MPPKATKKSFPDQRKSKKIVEKTPEERVRAKFRRLHDQLQDGFHEKGVKTCNQLLSLSPKDLLVVQVKVQLLIALDRFQEAASLLEEPEIKSEASGQLRLARSYCFYKQGREAQALDQLSEGQWGPDLERGASTLRAQTLYRLERYDEARDVYDELVATSDPTHPEHADLQVNLEATQARIDFIEAVPSHLGELSSTYPDIEMLEATPLAPLVASHEDFKPRAPVSESTAALVETGASKRKAKEPKPLDPNRPAPDPERWLPKRQRTGYVPPRSKMQLKKDKARQKLATQGFSLPAANAGKRKQGGRR